MPFSRLPALLKKIMILIIIKGFSMGVNTLMSKAFLASALMVTTPTTAMTKIKRRLITALHSLMICILTTEATT